MIIKSITSKNITTAFFLLTGLNFALATELKFPPDTPGLQTQTVQKNVNGKSMECLHVIIPNTNYSLFFPKDGSQPTTPETGLYSGAQYNNTFVADWYTKMFINPIITTIQSNIKQPFEESFSKITSNPVGKTLLYRLLIEIYRLDEYNNGCYEDSITVRNANLIQTRNSCCNLKIDLPYIDYEYDSYSTEIGFYPEYETLYLDSVSTKSNFVNRKTLNIKEEVFTLDEILFHEMIHWFHYLRNPQRFSDYKTSYNYAFQYPSRCFYGNTNDLESWGAHVDSEEITTILGVPNYNYHKYIKLVHPETFLKQQINKCIKVDDLNYIPFDARFLNGDDLSVNAYRIARGENSIRYAYNYNAPLPEEWRLKLYVTLAEDYYNQIMNLE